MELSGKRILLYARVSTDEQAKFGESIQDQLQALRRWAKEKQCVIVSEHVDAGYSAHKSYKSRPALAELLQRLPEADLVVFTKLDRWSRRSGDYYTLQDLLDAHHVSWIAILEDYETFTSEGRFKVGIMMSVNQHEAERTSDRVKFTFAQKRSRGEIQTGMLPLGYIIQDKRAVKDPRTKDAIEAFWHSYLSGAALSQARQCAIDNGLPMTYECATRLIRLASHYTGMIQGVRFEGYITEADLLTIQKRKRQKPRRQNDTFLFSGLVRCGVCGSNCPGHRGSRKYAEYRFYRCGKQSHGINCINRHICPERDIETFLLEHLNEIVRKEAETQRQILTAQPISSSTIPRLETKRQRAWEAYLDGLITKEQFAETARSIDAELETLRQKVSRKTPDQILTITPEGWQQTYGELDRDHKRQFWLRIIDAVTFHPDRALTVKLRT